MKAAKLALSLALFPATAGILTLSGCGSTPTTQIEKENLRDKGDTAVKTLTRQYPELQTLIDNGIGYAIFPSVGKGGLGVSVASGLGNVYEQGKYIGTSHLTKVGIGATIVGEDYTELLVFKDQNALTDFKANRLKFDAQASAVALKAGAHADAKFSNGVAVFVKTNSGLGFDASIGGQQFTYTADNGGGMNPSTQPGM